MIEVIVMAPTVGIADKISIFTRPFAGYQALIFGKPDVFVASYDIIKQRCVEVQMYWLLVVKEYIIVFYVIPTKVVQCIRIRPSGRIAKEHARVRHMPVYPRPKGIVVDLIYPDHV